MKRQVGVQAIILVVCSHLMPSLVVGAVCFDGLTPLEILQPGNILRKGRFLTGLTWYHSEAPNRLIINAEDHLEWLNPKAPDQVTVRLQTTDGKISPPRRTKCPQRAGW